MRFSVKIGIGMTYNGKKVTCKIDKYKGMEDVMVQPRLKDFPYFPLTRSTLVFTLKSLYCNSFCLKNFITRFSHELDKRGAILYVYVFQVSARLLVSDYSKQTHLMLL